jgi:predicted PurR-regulated permease PerM
MRELEEADTGSRTGWWLYVTLLGLAAAYIAHSFVGLLVLGVFGYYATRPICRRVGRHVDSDALSSALTVLLVLVPVVVVGLYAGLRVTQGIGSALSGSDDLPSLVAEYFALDVLPAEQRRALLQTLSNPLAALDTGGGMEGLVGMGIQILSTLASTLLFVALAVSLSFFLLQNDDDIATGLENLLGGAGSTGSAYARAVDSDLESVFFGDLLFIVAMTGISTLVYWGTNLVAPEGLRIPMVFVLAFLTGVASLIPIVVGKIIYLPVVGYLGLQALRTDESALAFVGIVLVVYFVLLDLLPQTFLQPYLSGRELDMMLLMFGYILGPILFGWYGFFLLPILLILMLHAVRIVLPPLVHGNRIKPTVKMGESIGTTPEEREDVTSTDGSSNESDQSKDVSSDSSDDVDKASE